MSFEEREAGRDMRLVGENYCVDCPDPEACHQGAPCDLVRMTASKIRRTQHFIIDEWKGLPTSTPETDEERLDRTNNVWVIDKPKGTNVPTSETGKKNDTPQPQDIEPEVDYDQSDQADEVQSTQYKVKMYLANLDPSRVLAYGVLGAAVIGLLRRKAPKRTRVDYHVYVHEDKKEKKDGIFG